MKIEREYEIWLNGDEKCIAAFDHFNDAMQWLTRKANEYDPTKVGWHDHTIDGMFTLVINHVDYYHLFRKRTFKGF